ncbi:putative mitochondrial hypothetical protein [Leptomonas pyrrhocoris]|uniref:Uncharacterized protein n=1 Tax=Leptomonas pyrrhocoris TaxID=157538 RepID=A0A0M9G386_LEPPY|nr:putative mitochondrial hypothetical protein [Leptomonas pyrrhocoris]KPA81327.1 putative mitochondrial hypothetical protein [Leptomonas pyrrhocoris]|eukprot:XP_015659766.1 putative mitochondrial hypothetical protein [Leptomonas pyrrhocoris]
MLRFTQSLLRVQSHQKKRAQHPNAGTRYGRVYNRGFIRYGFGGFGMSVYTPKKDRRFKVLPPPPVPTAEARQRDVFADNSALTATTRTLSPTFRMFALEDGGVLVSHPSHSQIMRWNQGVLTEEGKATNNTVMDEYVNSRIQAIIADNTVENASLSQWRKAHMWNIIKSHGNLQRRWGTPDYVKGGRSTLYNN